ncbi:MAG: NYN domain-containing protein, partial [Candidatus Komeilibacteria bacterium]|nr:NYN domain-containing protein [Candidatus Komeilibacteria bacterium]
YIVGSDENENYLRSQIHDTKILENNTSTLTPVIIKKLKDSKSVKGDDIALSVEALHHAYNRNIDIVHLFTGDGDYLPLIQEIKHLGVRVFVSAFNVGLNEKLKLEADHFFDLDTIYFPDVN